MEKGKSVCVFYVATIWMWGKGTIERVERNNEILARVTFKEMIKEANECEYGQGRYIITLSEEWIDEEGNYEFFQVREKKTIVNGTYSHINRVL